MDDDDPADVETTAIRIFRFGLALRTAVGDLTEGGWYDGGNETWLGAMRQMMPADRDLFIRVMRLTRQWAEVFEEFYSKQEVWKWLRLTSDKPECTTSLRITST
jgi:hypothetical protein